MNILKLLFDPPTASDEIESMNYLVSVYPDEHGSVEMTGENQSQPLGLVGVFNDKKTMNGILDTISRSYSKVVVTFKNR